MCVFVCVCVCVEYACGLLQLNEQETTNPLHGLHMHGWSVLFGMCPCLCVFVFVSVCLMNKRRECPFTVMRCVVEFCEL